MIKVTLAYTSGSVRNLYFHRDNIASIRDIENKGNAEKGANAFLTTFDDQKYYVCESANSIAEQIIKETEKK